MRIWSLLLIKSDLKWCIHLWRSHFIFYIAHESLFLCPRIEWSGRIVLFCMSVFLFVRFVRWQRLSSIFIDEDFIYGIHTSLIINAIQVTLWSITLTVFLLEDQCRTHFVRHHIVHLTVSQVLKGHRVFFSYLCIWFALFRFWNVHIISIAIYGDEYDLSTRKSSSSGHISFSRFYPLA